MNQKYKTISEHGAEKLQLILVRHHLWVQGLKCQCEIQSIVQTVSAISLELVNILLSLLQRQNKAYSFSQKEVKNGKWHRERERGADMQ